MAYAILQYTPRKIKAIPRTQGTRTIRYVALSQLQHSSRALAPQKKVTRHQLSFFSTSASLRQAGCCICPGSSALHVYVEGGQRKLTSVGPFLVASCVRPSGRQAGRVERGAAGFPLPYIHRNSASPCAPAYVPGTLLTTFLTPPTAARPLGLVPGRAGGLAQPEHESDADGGKRRCRFVGIELVDWAG